MRVHQAGDPPPSSATPVEVTPETTLACAKTCTWGAACRPGAFERLLAGETQAFADVMSCDVGLLTQGGSHAKPEPGFQSGGGL